MYRPDNRRSLLPLPLMVAIVCLAGAIQAQTPGQAPAQASAPQPSVATDTVGLSPEEQGDALMAQQRYQAAIEAYKEGDKKSAMLQNKLGIAYQLLGNIQAATRCYQFSLKIDPRNAKVLNNLGTIFNSQKEYTAAQKMYRKALKIDPKSAVVEKNLGTAYMAQHKYQKGAEAYQAAMALDPGIFDDSNSPHVENSTTIKDRGAMNFYMAKSCVRAGLNARAIEYLRRALNEGFTSPSKIMADEAFTTLRGLPAFDSLMESQRAQ